jgi:hypothetical protein
MTDQRWDGEEGALEDSSANLEKAPGRRNSTGGTSASLTQNTSLELSRMRSSPPRRIS